MIYLLLPIVLGLIPAAIAQSKGRSFLIWWLYGALLWIVALPHSLLLMTDQGRIDARAVQQGGKKCPHCAEIIRHDARVCRFCGREQLNGEIDATSTLSDLSDDQLVGTERRDENKVKDVARALGLGALLCICLILFFNRNSASDAGIVFSPKSTGSALEATKIDLAPSPSRCSTLGGVGVVKFVLCERGSTAIDWRMGGLASCDGQAVCNAWIWDDKRKAAKAMPMTDAQVNAARAVWVNATRQLNECGKSGC